MQELVGYLSNVMAGLGLVALLFFTLPRKQLLLRITVLILGFILVRDAMTPAGLWNFGMADSTLWLRFTNDSTVLVGLGVASILVATVLLLDKSLRKLVRWGSTNSPRTYIAGLAAGIFIALPFILLGLNTPIQDRGGVVEISLLPALLFMTLAGNFLEELIFRGFLQSYLAKHMSSVREVMISALMFATAHTFLATTVTNIGWPLLLFVTFEGLVCALVYKKYGLISSGLAHGLAIFLVASAMI